VVPALEAACGYAGSQVAATTFFPIELPLWSGGPCRRLLHLRFVSGSTSISIGMTQTDLRCDGCGQVASAAHVARRLQRLEWTSRYRPIHIGALLLGAVAPRDDADFLYSPEGKFAGEAGSVLQALDVTVGGKSADAILSAFQRGGFMLAHVLECPLEETNSGKIQELIELCLPATLVRIRRSLKPKMVVVISQQLAFAIARMQSADLNCRLVLDDGKPFALDGDAPQDAAERLRQLFAASNAVG